MQTKEGGEKADRTRQNENEQASENRRRNRCAQSGRRPDEQADEKAGRRGR